MKNYILVLSCLFLGNIAFSQEELNFSTKQAYVPKIVNFETSSFQVENECVLEVAGATPNSYVLYYDSPNGGKLLKRSKVSDKGSIKETFDIEHSPSFVLNTLKTIEGSAKGSGKVQYLGQKDFIIKNIDLSKNANALNIDFESLVNPKKEVTYEIWSENDQGEKKIVHVFNTNKTIEWDSYHFEYLLEPRTKYSFLVKSQGVERYSKKLYNSEGQNDFVVYPQVAIETISVEFKKVVEHSTYKIVDSKGVLYFTGEITDLLTKIEVSNLTAGSYFIRLDKYPKDAVSFTKL